MKRGFTFIEMIFVIVVMGILASFGAEIFRNVYLNYMLSSTNNRLQEDTENAIQQIANRLQYRIKNSVIASNAAGGFVALPSATNQTVLEWVGYDIDGWLGDAATSPTWSGFIDVDINAIPNVNVLASPASDFQAGGRIDTVIQNLSSSSIANAAIFFTGANSNIATQYGWGVVAQNEQSTTAAHRIGNAAAVNQIVPGVDDFSGVDVYEQYQLSWTAYALVLSANGDLNLYYDYQPWEGETYANVAPRLLMQNVDTFKFQGVGDMIKLQVCVNDNNILGDGGYSLCKEKAIF